MTIRVSFHEQSEAEGLVDVLLTAGFEAGVRRERLAGEDDDEEVVHVVHTDAPADEVTELVSHQDAWVEITDPMSGTSAAVETDAAVDTDRAGPVPPDLPKAPRRRKGDG